MRLREKPGSMRQFLAGLFVVAFALNWWWEMLQMPAFIEMMDRPWRATALLCTFAGLGDAAITLMIFAMVALATRRCHWAVAGQWPPYLAAALSGAAVAVAIEKAALAAGYWTYSGRMPVVPALGVGLVPLLQLMLLVPFAIRLSAWWLSPRQSDRGNG